MLIVPALINKQMISARTREDEVRLKRRMFDKEFSEVDEILRKADATLQKVNDSPIGNKKTISAKTKQVPQARSKSTLKQIIRRGDSRPVKQQPR
jgi:hypothetical protein